MPEPVDIDKVKAEIQTIETAIGQIDSTIVSKNAAFDKKNKELQERKNEIFKLKRELSDLEFTESEKAKSGSRDIESRINILTSKIRTTKNGISDYTDDISRKSKFIESLTKSKNELLQKWEAKNAEEFKPNDDKFTCPVNKTWNCPYGDEAIEESTEKAKTAFNTQKRGDIESIESQGKIQAQQIEKVKNEVKEITSSLAELNQLLIELETSLKAENDLLNNVGAIAYTDSEYVKKLRKQIESIESEITDVAPVNVSELKDKKSVLLGDLDVQKKSLTINDIIKQNETRIKELEKEGKNLAQQIADLERKEFTIEQFTKLKIDTLESRINNKFKLARFKMFEQLINGGEAEACITLVNGVPYSDSNHAAQLNYGLDIINTLSEFFDIYCPVWCDNAESTNNFIDTESQLIKLYVTKDDKLQITYE
jgi:chromosome segregation ATPase